MECLFCKIINQEIPSHKVYEDYYFYAFLDIAPKTKGHTLLVPKKHVKDLLSAQEVDIKGWLEVVQKIEKQLEEKLEIKGLTIMSNNKLGQDVPHLHWHLVPKYTKEDFALPKSISLDHKDILKKLT